MIYSFLALVTFVFAVWDRSDAEFILATLFLLCAEIKSSTDEIKKSIREHENEKKD